MNKTVAFLCTFSIFLAQFSFGLAESSDSAGSQNSIRRGDVLEVVILGRDELARTLHVMQDGTISYPLIGQLEITGLTTDEVADLIAEKLTKYFSNPVVSVFPHNPSSPRIAVFGEVVRSGAVDYQRGLRLTDYLALAGGPTEEANLKKIRVVRFIKEKPVVETVNLDRILYEGETPKNYELKSGDWIYLPEKFSFDWGLFFQITSIIISSVSLYVTLDRLE